MEGFVIRILLLNFAGINTTSEVRNSLYADSVTKFVHRHLPMHYFTWPPMCNPCAIWTKSAMGKLRKVDSFFRASPRISGNGACMHLFPFLSIAIFSHLLLWSLSTAQSATKLYIFKWDNGSCGLHDWHLASFRTLWSSSHSIFLVVYFQLKFSPLVG